MKATGRHVSRLPLFKRMDEPNPSARRSFASSTASLSVDSVPPAGASRLTTPGDWPAQNAERAA